ncbi:type II toxin-antitoxin system RelE/ParE family toxin [Acidobacteriota bacterium]
MKTFNIQLTQSAVDDLNNISEKPKAKIIASIQEISSHPFSDKAHIKKLKGFKPPLYRIRSGDHRVLYRIQDNIIYIIRVIDRKDLERIIKRLNL